MQPINFEGLRMKRSSSQMLTFVAVLAWTLAMATPAHAQTFTVLYTFTETTQGEQPDAGLIADSAGNLYGTTQYGGKAGGFGTIFKLDTSGNETVLYSFSGTPDGEDPYAGLAADGAGNLYGSTLYGGTNGGFGTLFRLSKTGKLNILHSFASDPDGADPYGTLVGDREGNGYGTTRFGGAGGGYGTVFRLGPNGKLTLVHSFSGTPDGEDPEAGLIIDAAGNLYGTTVYGGNAGGFGTVFKVNHNTGALTLLHSFAGTPDGENPYAGLAVDSTGNGYGTTKYGGTEGGYGTVFKIDRTGKFSLLHSFAGNPDGVNPLGAVTVDQQGNVYGTTYYGGTYGYGTVFKIDTAGDLTILHSFNDSPDGANPTGALLLDSAGNLYGTASQGGDSNCGFFGCGTIFEITP
jgi:uncharacterized repeat protein (TIGR03803 family)